MFQGGTAVLRFDDSDLADFVEALLRDGERYRLALRDRRQQ